MEENLVNLESNDLIVIKQLPVIEDRLDDAYNAVQERLSAASGLAVTEDNYKEIKKTRAELNKEFGELESMRKRVKQALEGPYKRFESGAYKRIADAYKNAIEKLDSDIKDVEGTLKTERQKELFAYYEDYRKSLGLSLDFADARRSGIKIGLSGSMKSYKDQARQYLDRIDGDLKMIDTLDNRDEVLAEYRVLLNVADAVRVVADRKKRIEEERQRREAEAAEKAARDEHIAAVQAAIEENEPSGAAGSSETLSDGQGDALASPTAQVAEEQSGVSESQVYSTVFRVTGTLDMLRALKVFLVDGGYEFENVKGE